MYFDNKSHSTAIQGVRVHMYFVILNVFYDLWLALSQLLSSFMLYAKKEGCMEQAIYKLSGKSTVSISLIVYLFWP